MPNQGTHSQDIACQICYFTSLQTAGKMLMVMLSCLPKAILYE